MYRLLIVDDEPEIRHGLGNYIRWDELGFIPVGEAEDGKQALDFIRTHPVDVILCDIKMPVMSGIELAKQLKEERAPVKVVFLSVYRDFEFAREALILGVTDYILKRTKYAELARVFSQIRAELDARRGDGGEAGCNYNGQIIEVVKEHVKSHYQNTTLEEVSKLVHLNPNYLSKFFKEKTGENFSDYLLKIRMQKAAELLRTIHYKTYQISEMVGYSNPKNFTRTFRKYFGKSPREFRNGDRNGAGFQSGGAAARRFIEGG